MKITEIKLSILERPGGGEHRLVQVPGLRRIQYTHKGFPTSRPEYHPFLIVCTDDGSRALPSVPKAWAKPRTWLISCGRWPLARIRSAASTSSRSSR